MKDKEKYLEDEQCLKCITLKKIKNNAIHTGPTFS